MRHKLGNKKLVARFGKVRRFQQILDNGIQQWNPSTFMFYDRIIGTLASAILAGVIAHIPLDGHNHSHKEGPNLDPPNAGSRELPGKTLCKEVPEGSIVIPVFPRTGIHCKIPNSGKW